MDHVSRASKVCSLYLISCFFKGHTLIRPTLPHFFFPSGIFYSQKRGGSRLPRLSPPSSAAISAAPLGFHGFFHHFMQPYQLLAAIPAALLLFPPLSTVWHTVGSNFGCPLPPCNICGSLYHTGVTSHHNDVSKAGKQQTYTKIIQQQPALSRPSSPYIDHKAHAVNHHWLSQLPPGQRANSSLNPQQPGPVLSTRPTDWATNQGNYIINHISVIQLKLSITVRPTGQL